LDGLKTSIEGFADENERQQLLDDTSSSDPAARKRVTEFLSRDPERAALAGAVSLRAGDEAGELFERLIAQAEVRRNSLLREIDRHRDATIARRLRQASEEIQDAEFEDFKPSE
jgi:hypothetical protein